jgi:hypothetical protein
MQQETNWDYLRHLITAALTLHVRLKTEGQIEDAVKYFNDIIQWNTRNGVSTELFGLKI